MEQVISGKEISEELKLTIVNLYNNGLSISKVADQVGVHKSTVSKWVKRAGSSIRDPKIARRLYTHNPFAFDQSTPEKSYWLGFLLADGCVCRTIKGSPALAVALQQRDTTHLEKLKTFLGAKHPIGNDDKRCCSSLVIHSDELVNSLETRGMFPRKSNTLEYPESGLFYRNHFIRGYFDGDGSIYVNEKVYRQPTASFLGTEQFLLGLQEILNIETGLSANKLYRAGNSITVKSLAWTGRNNIKLLYQYLYQDSTVHLERKKQKFEYALSY